MLIIDFLKKQILTTKKRLCSNRERRNKNKKLKFLEKMFNNPSRNVNLKIIKVS